MRMCGNSEENAVNVSLENRRMKDVIPYRYLQVDISNDERLSENVNQEIDAKKRKKEKKKKKKQ